ncbi:MAG: DUF3570 domain-containing protein [Polyangiaceae bacterium]
MRHLAAAIFGVFGMVGIAHAEATPIPSPAPESTATPVDVRASSEIATYADSDHVFVVSPTIAGSFAKPTAGWSFGGRYLVDVVSGASVDIVSTASRRWEEIRQVGAVDAAYKPGNFGIAANANISSEPDYLSLSAGGTVTQDLLAKNLTLLLGYNHGHDVGGRTGTPFSVFSRKLDREGIKTGLTYVLDHATILSIVGDLGIEHGDPSKPYRYVPVFAPGTSVPKGASIDVVTQLRLSARPLEQLPLTRDRYALAARIAHRFGGATLRVDERGYVDSWGLKASTTDTRLIFDLGRRVELGPHVRFHVQSAVDFWQRAYVMRPGFDFPALRTGDRELGPLVGVTGGGSFRYGTGPSANPRASVLGFDLNLTTTQYLDDLYLKSRISRLGAVTWEVQL